jgi:Spy/CpxP family protein refolding chaperone
MYHGLVLAVQPLTLFYTSDILALQWMLSLGTGGQFVIRNRSLIRYAAVALTMTGLLLAQNPGNPPGTGAPGAGNRMANRLDKLAALLNLTPGQKTQVGGILQNSFDQAKPLMGQMRDNRQAIEQLVKSGTTENFDQQLQTLANTQASLTSQLTVIHAKAMAQAWNLLTPDQRQKADQLHELMGPGMGMMGRGPGMRGQGMPMHSPQGQ